MSGKVLFDFDPGARVPQDTREAMEVAQQAVARLGTPPRTPDGNPQLLVATRERDGVLISLHPLARALDECPDPEIRAVLHRARDQAASFPLSVIVLAIGREGDWWCAPVGPAPTASEVSA